MLPPKHWLIASFTLISVFPTGFRPDAVVCVAEDPTSDSTAPDLAQFYGFTGVELFKLNERASNLQHGDFNSDGLTDLLVVDNRASCLRLLIQRTEPAAVTQRDGKQVNDLKSDWRFDIRQVSVDKQVAGLSVADLNSDGRVDVAYVGIPDRLIIRYQPEDAKAEWSDKWSVRLPKLRPASWMIATGDLNGDGRTDVAVLGEEATYIIRQKEDGTPASPEALINTSQQLSLIQIADLNGDGRNDLCYMANEGSNRGLCARMQTADGRLGPEIIFDLRQPRSVTLADVDQQPGREIITVESRTGRIFVSAVQPPEPDAESVATRLLQFGVGPSSGSRPRAWDVGDIDGDALNDVVFADPEQAQVLVYRQNGIDGLGTAEIFPALLGINDICVADFDADGADDLMMISEKEAILAISRFKDGRLSFPEPVMKQPEGEEFSAIAAVPSPDGTQLVVCTTRGSGRSAKALLYRVRQDENNEWKPQDETPIELPPVIGSRGLNIVAMNVDGDDRGDVLIVPNGSSSTATVQVLIQSDDGGFTTAANQSNLDLGISSAAGMFANGQQLLVARDSFARLLTFGDKGWQVDDQFNAGESSARLNGVAALDIDGKPGDEIVLVDSGVKKLRILRKEGELFRPWKEVELGSLRFSGATVADLNGDQRADLLLAGATHFSVLYAGVSNSELREVASFEIDRDNAYPSDVIVGDINGDSQIDLSVIDTSIDGIQILRFDGKTGIAEATHFRVFEEKRLVSESSARGTEPREGLAVDVTGDGRNDLVLLCHDRLILYPQDPGASEDAATAEPPADPADESK
jgi:FG-GAP-like repeat